MTEPKLYFDSEKELFDCLSEWQPRLGLSDWHIAARLCDIEDMKLKDVAGESEVQYVNMCGLISIVRKEDMPADMILKQPHEQVLIHELLHFKFISYEVNSRDQAVFEENQHQLIELLAKALFSAKYGLKHSWFIDEKHKYEEHTPENQERRILQRYGLRPECLKGG